MSELKQFGHAVKEADAGKKASEEAPVDVLILDRKVSIFTPSSGQAAYLSFAISEAREDIMSIGRIINFVLSIMDEDDQAYVRGLLLERGSGFDGEDLVDLARHLIEEWSARPTEKPSDSAPSQGATGKPSKGATKRVVSPS